MPGIPRPHIKPRILAWSTRILPEDVHLSRQTRSIDNPSDNTSSLYFHYPSGRWLINEAHQPETYYTNFNVPSLQRTTSRLM
ncbi:uncharacterized protein BP01DRAFT_358753 [Aspergillus saccharolyticus JOP 1030-1]|uniref:Uncharacterized protein n=1 Tax=Aspergillus saccharolyticus JOP 1030-1 TaxID=1450539 RepID=A0A318ZA83_9EURO|nr:hypothetical protein BP01DRAFT_358753 [Aspergillus saccharolyticus JOP 1030-1]PYH43234.1 hypothetical protein BP01DRAFT_358753 [Aspergillus saccharolyticus JOP 1030-1]